MKQGLNVINTARWGEGGVLLTYTCIHIKFMQLIHFLVFKIKMKNEMA